MADPVNKAVHESKKFLDWQSIKQHYHEKQGEVANSETRQQNFLIPATLKWLSHNDAILSMSKKSRYSNRCSIHNRGLLYTKICYINALNFVNVTATEKNMNAFIS